MKIDWQNIDTVLLDMDGTLLDLHFDNYFWGTFLVEKYAEKRGITFETAQEQLSIQYQSIRGTQDWYCIDYWSSKLELDVLALKTEVQHMISLLPHATEFLETIQNKKQVILVTNAHLDTLNLKIQKTKIDQYFDSLICAHDYKHAKEEIEFWQILNNNISFDKARTLLIDDNLDVLSTARQYGIQHLLAISEPDSTLGENATKEFQSIKNFKKITENFN